MVTLRFAFILTPLLLLLFVSCSKAPEQYTQWSVSGGSKEGIRYSSLTQIDTSNVGDLKIAWVYHTKDADSINHSQIQCNPIVVDGVVYGTSPQIKLFAIDAKTGKEKWVFDPKNPGETRSQIDFILNNNRGVTYWAEGDDKRILYCVGSFLHAIDATTGKLIPSFGIDGRIDLHDGLDRDVHDLYVASTSPGIIFQDMIIMGTRVSENADAAPGHIRAFDIHTGKRRWIFHTIPQPGEFGFDSWQDTTAYQFIGGANAWSGFTLDETRGILFVPTGSAAFDFYGGKRKGDGLFSNCLLAIDAATGKRLWHFQNIHHDVWDKDFPTPPALVTVVRDGKKIDAVAQPTKLGFIYVLERETGKSLFEIAETPVPHDSELIGEQLSPTQPIPSLPVAFTRQSFTENDLNTLVSDSSYQDIRTRFSGYKRGHMFMPPSKQGTIFFPGLDGGAEWGGPAFDPATGILYVNSNEIPWVITMTDVESAKGSGETYFQAGQRIYKTNCVSCHGVNREGGGNYPAITRIEKKYTENEFVNLVGSGRRMMPAFKHLPEEERKALAAFILNLKSEGNKPFINVSDVNKEKTTVPYTITGYNKFLSKEGYPAINPPWGTLNAVNLNTGKMAWRIPLGDYPEFKAKGIHTGTENYGGPVVTAGGLIFIAATRDGKFRAFNKQTGKMLWETDLPAPGFATPAMYEVDGKQFIVIACGGGKLGTRSGDAYVAYSLP